MPNHCWAFASAWLLLGGLCSSLSAATNNVARDGSPYRIDVWETEHGLPRNSILAMTQTRDGYLWLGTPNGLVRFDGIRFTVFDEGNTPGLKSDRIVSLYEDSKSNLWIGTETAGVAVMKDGVVTSVDLGRGTNEAAVLTAGEDSTGAIWFYGMDGQLRGYRDGRPGLKLPGNYRALIATNSGALWVEHGWPPQPAMRSVFLFPSQRHGYWRLADGHVEKWTTAGPERNFQPYAWKDARISAACEDRQGNLVVGTRGDGVFWFDAQGRATPLSINEGLSYNYILSLHVDREGSLWVGTDGGGLNRVRRQVMEVLEETRGLVVQSVCEDNQARLWIGYNSIDLNANGASYWKDGEMKWFGWGQGLWNASVRSVFAERNGQVWAGTPAGLFQFEDKLGRWVAGSNSVLSKVRAIHQDRRGQLWVGTESGLVEWGEKGPQMFTTTNGLSANDVQAIADDREGNLWVGTVGGAVHRLWNGQFTLYRENEETRRKDISSLYADDDGVLWIGTDGNGLARLQRGKWTRYTTRDGLVSNSIGYIIEDSQGYLWIGSNAGLMRVRKKSLNDFTEGSASLLPIRTYRKTDGLPTSECSFGSQPGAWRAKDGKLWLPTIKGLVSVDPAHLNPNTNPPPVIIESVLIDNQAQNKNRLRVSWPEAVVVPAGKESLEIHYTSLNLAVPERARFRYRLEGHETAWTEVGDIRVAHYTKVPAGRYRFQVTACNEDGVWNATGSTLAVIVQPPFWATWWFLTAVTVCLLGFIVGVVHYLSTQRLHRQLETLRQKEALEKDRARIARDIHDQLGASLTQVSLLGELVQSDKDSPAEVEGHARQITQTARDTTRVLDEIVWTVNPSNDTLDGLINYVCKYAQEYLAVAGLRYRLDVPAQLPDASISPEVRHNVFLAAKEAVTNVVRHAHASSVCLRLTLARNAFTLDIQDDGRGPSGMDESRAQSRSGLRNMAKRMEDIGGSFAIGPATEGGTLVRLTAPIGKL